MRIIKLEKIDKLTSLAEELEVIIYLEELVKFDKISRNFSEFENIVQVAENYLLELNKQTVDKFCLLVNEKNFTQKIKKLSRGINSK